MSSESEWYFGGNPEHHGKLKRYIATPRELLRLLHSGKLHVFKWTNQAEFLGEATAAGEGRVKTLCDARKVYASNEGLYILV